MQNAWRNTRWRCNCCINHNRNLYFLNFRWSLFDYFNWRFPHSTGRLRDNLKPFILVIQMRGCHMMIVLLLYEVIVANDIKPGFFLGRFLFLGRTLDREYLLFLLGVWSDDYVPDFLFVAERSTRTVLIDGRLSVAVRGFLLSIRVVVVVTCSPMHLLRFVYKINTDLL